METLTHRRTENTLSDRAIVIQFCDDDSNQGYGDHVWTLKTELPYAGNVTELIEFAVDFYETDADEAIRLVNPENIVNSAGAWDDEDFIEAVWKKFEPTGYRTWNGAVVLDPDQVEMEYSFENE